MAQVYKLSSVVMIYASLLALTGCYSSTDVSRVSPFNLYVGKTVRLERSVGIENPGALVPHSRIDCSLGDLPTNGQDSNSHPVKPGRESGKTSPLAAGHMVHIDRVVDEITGDNEAIIAYGHCTLSPSGNLETKFAYMWGFVWVLGRAPWEPGTVPPKRYPPFKVPPHWDYPIFDHGKPGSPMWGTPDPNATLPVGRG